eukprot:SAG31_NODE_18848_length_620_cov_1.197697_1_plen_172_part_10
MATVVFLDTWLDDHIPAAGWTLGKPPYPSANLTFAEHNSSGPGARPSRPAPARVLGATEAAGWTVGRVLKGWNPQISSQQPYCWDSAAGCVTRPQGFADKQPPLKADDDSRGISDPRCRLNGNWTDVAAPTTRIEIFQPPAFNYLNWRSSVYHGAFSEGRADPAQHGVWDHS